MRRYDNKSPVVNNHPLYRGYCIDRGIPYIRQLRTQVLRFPSAEEVASLDLSPVVWGVGSRLYKLADEFYGNPEMWWVIAQFNERPTEAHISLGDVIYIPRPLEKIIGLLGVV